MADVPPFDAVTNGVEREGVADVGCASGGGGPLGEAEAVASDVKNGRMRFRKRSRFRIVWYNQGSTNRA